MSGSAYVHLTVEKATQLLAVDRVSVKPPDPCCVIICGQEKFATTIKTKELNPVWNETFTLTQCHDPGTDVFIRVVHKDESSGCENLGQLVLPFESLTSACETKAYPLEKCIGMSEVTGELYISAKVEPISPTDATIAVVSKDLVKSFASIDQPDPNFLLVTVIKARDLVVVDDSGESLSSDPFVKLKYGKQRFRTKTIKKSLAPIWKEMFAFELNSKNQSLEIVVEDEDSLVNQYMGSVSIDIATMIHDNRQTDGPTWYSLEDARYLKRSSKSKIKGELLVNLQMKHLDYPMGDFIQGEVDVEMLEAAEVSPTVSEDNSELEELRKKMLSELRDIEFKDGDYQIQVHLIEVRSLASTDLNGSTDPVISVECMGMKKYTQVKKCQTSCVFDELLFFNFTKVKKEEIECATVKVSVLDADGPAAIRGITGLWNDMIGSFCVDIPYVYYRKHHEMHRQWVALMDEENVENTSVRGYLKLSVVVLGPGDRLHVQEVSKEQAEKDSVENLSAPVLMPPRIKQELHFLVVTIHQAEHLPNMDNALLRTGGIDTFVRIEFSGKSAADTKTRTAKGSGELDVQFNQEMWLPVIVPTISDRIRISVWDYDLIGNDLVATSENFSFSQVQKYPELHQKIWVNLYGATLTKVGKSEVGAFMNRHPSAGTTYRGRLLISLREDLNEGLYGMEGVHSKRASRVTLPPNLQYTLRAFVISGNEIPQIFDKQTPGNTTLMSVRVCIGKHELTTLRQANVNGMVHWAQYLHSEHIFLPQDPEQIPDIFVYLVRGTGKTFRNISYARFKATEIMQKGFSVGPEWVNLKGDKVLGDITDATFPGAVLLRLAFGKTQLATAAGEWDVSVIEKLAPYKLFLHVFQGRQLPPADSNGLIDPYIRVHACGQMKQLPKKLKTRNPCWYETVEFDVELPTKEYMPEINVQCFDYDAWDSDDYVGSVRLRISQTCVADKSRSSKTPVPRPRWYPLCFQEDGDTEGELLLSYELIRKGSPDVVVEKPASIAPEMENAYLEIIALGLRGLKPVNFTPVNMPYIQFDLGDETYGNCPVVTSRSKFPSSDNPNFLERIVMPCQIPLDALFAPRLHITVIDYQLGGFFTPGLGTASVSLGSKMEFSNGKPNPDYQPPGEIAATGNPNISRRPNVSTFLGVKSMLEKDLKDQGFSEATAPGVYSTVPKETPPEAADSRPDVSAGDREALLETFLSNEEDEIPEYLKEREVLLGTLEEKLRSSPFETYSIFTGQKQGRQALGVTLPSNYRPAGTFKGLIRLVKSPKSPPLFDLKQFMRPKEYLVRVYVLNGSGFQPCDTKGKSDPYLRLKLGNEQVVDRNFKPKTLNPQFHTLYELKAKLPGASKLTIDVYDHDTITSDDFIGSTVIDLEDRLFDDHWQSLGASATNTLAAKPVENRPLWSPVSTVAQGSLNLWIEILSTTEATQYPPTNISIPPPEDFELRLIVWKTRDVVPADEFSGLTDMYVSCWIGGALDSKAIQKSDTHWRCREGKGSFNWRMKFPVSLPTDKEGGDYVYIALWDRDLLYDDCLGESVVSLKSAMRTAYKTKQAVCVFAADKGRTGLDRKGTRSHAKGRRGSWSDVGTCTAADAWDERESSADVGLSWSANHADKNADIEAGENAPLLDQDSQRGKEKRKKANVKRQAAQSLVWSLKHMLGMGHDPVGSKWITLTTRDNKSGEKSVAGQVLVSMEILPKTLADTQPAGLGRSEPNNFPILPDPYGRLELSALWNPLYVLEALAGPRAYNTCVYLVVAVSVVATVIFGGPFIYSLLILVQLIPSPYGWILFASFVGILILSCAYGYHRIREQFVRSLDAGSTSD